VMFSWHNLLLPEVAILVGTVPELLFMGCSWLPSFSAG